MVDFETLTLSSITLLTAAMFIFYYLLVIKTRRTPPVIQKRPQTPPEVQTSISQTKIEDPPPNPIQMPTQVPVQIKAPTVETPTHTQSQISSQTPVQAAPQISVQAPPPENVINIPVVRAPILRGEDATEALKEFAEELEKGRSAGAEKTRDASLIKLARVLIDVIQADKPPEKIAEQPNQDMKDVEGQKMVSEPPHEHDHSEKEKKTKMHKRSRIRTGKRKPKAKKKTITKSNKHRRQAKKHSRTTQVTSKRAQKGRHIKKRTDKKST
jgi:hypothetical protein